MNAIVPHRLQGAPLEGEILGPEDCLEVIVALNIFQLGAARILVPAGSTIGEIVDAALAQHVGPKPARVVALIGDQVIPERVWGRVRPKPHAFVAVRGAPGKEGGILRNILLLAVGVASLAIPGLFPALSPFATSLIGAGLALGGTLLINALFPIRPPKLEDKGGVSQTYSIAGGSNTADPHGPIPFILGTHRYTPHLAARTYTEYTGGDQYYIAAFYWAYGSINIEDVKLGETPVGNYEDVRFQSDGYFLSDSETINLMPTQVIEETLSVGLTNAGGWVTRTTAENTDRITLDVVAPNGVYKIKLDNGKRKENKCTVAGQYRRVGQSNWMTLKNWDFTSKSTEAIRKGVSLNVSRGQYQVRVKKTSGDPDPENKDKTVIEDLYWTALRSFRNGRPVNFDGPLAVSAIRIRATGQLNGTISNLNGIIKSRHYSWNGSAWKFGNSNNPADLYRHVLQGPFNARPVPTGRIDLERLQEFWSYCNAKGFAFNQVRDFRASVWDCLQDICGSAMAAPCFRDGLWSVAWDDPSAPVVGHFTPRNSRGFAGNRDYKTAPHALRVDFINEAAGYARDERIVFADGYNTATATLYERIEFPGITSATIAWKLARLHMAQAKLRPETYRLVVAREHFRATFGDRVRVSHDIPLIGLTSGRVKAVDGQVITLDEPVLMEGGNSYQIRFQLSGGDSLLRSVTYDAGAQTVVTLTGTDDEPAVGDLFMFGRTGTESAVFRIRSIRAIDEAEAELTLVDDAANLWDAVTGTIPAFDSQITIPPDPSTLAPTNLRVAEQLVAVGDVPTFAATFSWETLPGSAAVAFHTEIRDDNGDNEWRPLATVPAPQQSVIDISLYESDWSFRTRAVFEDGSVSAWTTIEGQTIAGGVPPDVANFRVTAQEATATLSWDQVNTFGLDYYMIRFTTETDPELAEWNTATQLTTALSTSVQVPTLTGTYLIKAVNIVGTESVNAAILTSALGDISSLNVIQLYELGPSWPGTFDGCEVNDDDALQLIAQPGVLDWGPILGIPSNYWSSRLESTVGTFTGEVIDLGEVSTSRVVPSIGEVTLEGGVESTAWSARWLARITDDDPDDDPTWSEPFAVAVGDYRFRALEPILEIRSLALGVHPQVASASLEIDMPDQLRAGENIEITEAGMFVPFTPPFRQYGGMGVADNDPDARVIASNANTDGFQVTAIDGSGDFVPGVKFSYNAKGAGSRSAAAAAGALYGWGLGTHGRLGNGSSAPSVVPVPTFIHAGPWTAVSAGFNFSVGIRDDGTLWAWGRNDQGQLGLGDTVDRVVPTKVGTKTWASVSAGDKHVAAIDTDGKLFTWGQNSAGWLGHGDLVGRSSPTQVGSSDWSKVVAGAYNTFAIRDDGKLFGCGLNDDSFGLGGIIGDGSIVNRSSFVAVGAAYDWVDVAPWEFDRCMGIQDDGTIWYWGQGYGTNNPTQLGMATSYVSLVSGSVHTHIITADGSLRGIGFNDEGQLGTGDAPTAHSASITLVLDSDDGQVDQVVAAPPGEGKWAACIMADGTLRTWGINADGQLGNGNAPTSSDAPTQISAQIWSQVAAGASHGLAILDVAE